MPFQVSESNLSDSSDDDLPSLLGLSFRSFRSEVAPKRSIEEILEQNQGLKNAIVLKASQQEIESKSGDLQKESDPPCTENFSPSPDAIEEVEGLDCFFGELNWLQYFSAEDVTFFEYSCSTETAPEEDFLLFLKQERLIQLVFQKCLPNLSFKRIKNIEMFTIYVLKKMSVNYDETYINNCKYVIEKIVTNHNAISVLFTDSDIFQILFNYGVDVDRVKFFEMVPHVKKYEKRPCSVENSIPDNWLFNLEAVLTSLKLLIKNCRFKPDALLNITLYLIIMSIDTNMHLIFTELQDCLATALTKFPESSWHLYRSRIISLAKTLPSTFLLRMVESLPCTQRGIELCKFTSFTVLKQIAKPDSPPTEYVVDFLSVSIFLSVVDAIRCLDPFTQYKAIKFIDMFISQLEFASHVEYHDVYHSLKNWETSINTKTKEENNATSLKIKPYLLDLHSRLDLLTPFGYQGMVSDVAESEYEISNSSLKSPIADEVNQDNSFSNNSEISVTVDASMVFEDTQKPKEINSNLKIACTEISKDLDGLHIRDSVKLRDIEKNTALFPSSSESSMVLDLPSEEIQQNYHLTRSSSEESFTIDLPVGEGELQSESQAIKEPLPSIIPINDIKKEKTDPFEENKTCTLSKFLIENISNDKYEQIVFKTEPVTKVKNEHSHFSFQQTDELFLKTSAQDKLINSSSACNNDKHSILHVEMTFEEDIQSLPETDLFKSFAQKSVQDLLQFRNVSVKLESSQKSSHVVPNISTNSTVTHEVTANTSSEFLQDVCKEADNSSMKTSVSDTNKASNSDTSRISTENTSLEKAQDINQTQFVELSRQQYCVDTNVLNLSNDSRQDRDNQKKSVVKASEISRMNTVQHAVSVAESSIKKNSGENTQDFDSMTFEYQQKKQNCIKNSEQVIPKILNASPNVSPVQMNPILDFKIQNIPSSATVTVPNKECVLLSESVIDTRLDENASNESHIVEKESFQTTSFQNSVQNTSDKNSEYADLDQYLETLDKEFHAKKQAEKQALMNNNALDASQVKKNTNSIVHGISSSKKINVLGKPSEVLNLNAISNESFKHLTVPTTEPNKENDSDLYSGVGFPISTEQICHKRNDAHNQTSSEPVSVEKNSLLKNNESFGNNSMSKPFIIHLETDINLNSDESSLHKTSFKSSKTNSNSRVFTPRQVNKSIAFKPILPASHVLQQIQSYFKSLKPLSPVLHNQENITGSNVVAGSPASQPLATNTNHTVLHNQTNMTDSDVVAGSPASQPLETNTNSNLKTPEIHSQEQIISKDTYFSPQKRTSTEPQNSVLKKRKTAGKNRSIITSIPASSPVLPNNESPSDGVRANEFISQTPNGVEDLALSSINKSSVRTNSPGFLPLTKHVTAEPQDSASKKIKAADVNQQESTSVPITLDVFQNKTNVSIPVYSTGIVPTSNHNTNTDALISLSDSEDEIQIIHQVCVPSQIISESSVASKEKSSHVTNNACRKDTDASQKRVEAIASSKQGSSSEDPQNLKENASVPKQIAEESSTTSKGKKIISLFNLFSTDATPKKRKRHLRASGSRKPNSTSVKRKHCPQQMTHARRVSGDSIISSEDDIECIYSTVNNDCDIVNTKNVPEVINLD